jgi:phosphatidate cytidylyltransferase
MSIVPLWGGDTAAIFVGRWIGKHPLAPSISPQKTIEGGVANLLACVLVAVVLGALLAISWPASLACGLVAGVFGQAGDLFESALKRRAGLKDSGALLPGHGGLLDRIDSILFTATPVLAILSYTPPTR